jgi:chromosome segregation ATPase
MTNEIKILSILETMAKDVSGLNQRMGRVEQDIGELKQDVASLKKDVGELKHDVSTLKKDVRNLTQRVDKLEEGHEKTHKMEPVAKLTKQSTEDTL